MDKDTRIELLKVFGMIVILVVLICGIVYLNKAHDVAVNEANTVIEKNTAEETNTEKSEESKSEKKSDNSSKSSQEKDNSKKD